MNARTPLVLAFAASLLAAGLAAAQDAKPKKLYRWVDKDGKVQFSDTLPPEAVDSARTEINAQSGATTASVDRAMTPEERAAWEVQQAEEAKRLKEEELARQSEEAMLASFQTEEELMKSFGERIELKKQNIEAIEAGLAGQRASLASLLAEASEAELAGRAVDARQAKTIRELHVEMGRQQQMLIVREVELANLGTELERLVKRFRELKAPETAAPAPAADAPQQAPAG